jgi:hypothetical protein
VLIPGRSRCPDPRSLDDVPATGQPYRVSRQGARCSLRRRACELLSDSTGSIVPELSSVLDAITGTRQPRSALNWHGFATAASRSPTSARLTSTSGCALARQPSWPGISCPGQLAGLLQAAGDPRSFPHDRGRHQPGPAMGAGRPAPERHRARPDGPGRRLPPAALRPAAVPHRRHDHQPGRLPRP